MAGRNGTGPNGNGPMTGRQMGNCGTNPSDDTGGLNSQGSGMGRSPGMGRGPGLGRGQGMGRGHGMRHGARLGGGRNGAGFIPVPVSATPEQLLTEREANEGKNPELDGAK